MRKEYDLNKMKSRKNPYSEKLYKKFEVGQVIRVYMTKKTNNLPDGRKLWLGEVVKDNAKTVWVRLVNSDEKKIVSRKKPRDIFEEDYYGTKSSDNNS